MIPAQAKRGLEWATRHPPNPLLILETLEKAALGGLFTLGRMSVNCPC
jgi:hypothetical protein